MINENETSERTPKANRDGELINKPTVIRKYMKKMFMQQMKMSKML